MRSSEARRLIKMNHLDPCTKKNGDVNVLKTVQVKILKEFPSAIIKKFIHLIYTDVLMRGSSCALYSFSLTKEESRGNVDHVNTFRDYKTKIESELSGICDRILKLLESTLIPSATSEDSKVFYLKVKGDYFRYLAEFKIGAKREAAADSTLSAYESAQENKTKTNMKRNPMV
ncbi:unnamed protein product [Microthlaspi erraticum]|uniref:14-3-3 domain-containing protein n=1 Tax=Microthlaspi erraticum TaxID=1685480 RepID=A0A6D2HVD9_9BRAS|nr:unnamed protein product [Microthlaspi erraticum]